MQDKEWTIALKNDDEHPLDEPLGTLHEVAIKLACLGLHDLAAVVATAHEQIQNWAINLSIADILSKD